MTNGIVPFPGASSQNADEHAARETERRLRLFAWAESLLRDLGFDRAIAAARTIEELHRIVLDVDAPDIVLAIRAALHPASGTRDQHFIGLSKGPLQRILQNRFSEWRKEREEKLGKAGKTRQADWTDQLILGKDDTVVANLANLELILRESPDWKGVFGHDDFAKHVVVRKIPPWGFEAPGTQWEDRFDSAVRIWFQRVYYINPATGDVGRAIQKVAADFGFHPVRDYFNALPDWDGTARADTFLPVFFKTADTPYTRAVGVRWLISSVARILRPGEQVDHLLVAEGPQGWFKSTGFRMLVKDKGWFTDRLSNINSKDAAMELSGRQIIEIAEMETLLRATSGAKKAFLTRLDDKFRPPYAKRLISLARQCVFCGTVNPVMHEGRFEGYLDDSTGARRFWLVTCLAPVDYKGIAEIRDQLWAEVLFRFKAGEPWHLETPELEALAKAEQDKRYKADKFEAPIREYLDEDNRNDTSIKEILRDVFGHTGKGHHSHEIRIARILTDWLGFERYRSTLKKRPWRYRRVPEHAENIGGENRDKWDGALSQMSQFPGEKSKPTTSTKPITKGRSKKDGTRSRGKTRTKAKDHRRGRSRKRR